MTPHLEEALLHELVDGEVPSTELGPIQAHLAACPECRGRLEEARALAAETDRLIEALDDEAPAADPVERPARPRRIRWAASLAWAATLVLAAGLGYYARGGLPVPVQETAAAPATPAPALEPAAATEAPAPAGTLAPTPPRAERKVATPPAERNEQPVELKSRRAEPIIAPRASAAPAPALASRDQAMASGVVGAAKAAEAAAPDTISFVDAMERMRGSLRTIEGLVPLRLEALGADVRVIYPVEGGQLVLAQRLVGGRVRWELTAPAGFPADSLARLRLRIRE